MEYLIVGTRPAIPLAIDHIAGTLYDGLTSGVNIQIPLRSWGIKINDRLLELQPQFLQHDVGAMSVGTSVVGVQMYLWLRCYTIGAVAVCVAVGRCHCHPQIWANSRLLQAMRYEQ